MEKKKAFDFSKRSEAVLIFSVPQETEIETGTLVIIKADSSRFVLIVLR